MIEKAGVPEVNQAVDFIYKMSEDEKIREMAEAREAFLRDQRSAFSYYEGKGMEEGMKKGMEKGIEEGIEKTITTMRKAGVPEDMIQTIIDMMQSKK